MNVSERTDEHQNIRIERMERRLKWLYRLIILNLIADVILWLA